MAMNWALKEAIILKVRFEKKIDFFRNNIEWSRHNEAQENYKKMKDYIYSERKALDRKLEKLERINHIWTGQKQ